MGRWPENVGIDGSEPYGEYVVAGGMFVVVLEAVAIAVDRGGIVAWGTDG